MSRLRDMVRKAHRLSSPTKTKVEAAFHEVWSKIPRTVVQSGKTGKARKAMMTAIALSKARRRGAHIPKYG